MLIGVFVQKYFLSAATVNQKARIQPAIGSKLNVSDVNFSKSTKNISFSFLQTGCRFCNESASFYKISENIQNKNVKLVAVFPTSIEESKAHLNELGLTKLEVRRSPFDNIQVSGTPTLILANEKGEITDYWVGKLTSDKEMEVINNLNS